MIAISLNNILTLEGVILVSCVMVRYDVDFVAIFCHDLHDREFGELNNLPFPCKIQRLCNKNVVLEILGIGEMVPG